MNKYEKDYYKREIESALSLAEEAEEIISHDTFGDTVVIGRIMGVVDILKQVLENMEEEK
jgi:DNA-binding winged helix-turn-helix (wHTH) protein